MNRKSIIDSAPRVPNHLQRLISKGRRTEVMRLLEKLIDDDGGLFHDDQGMQESRRLSWLLRIDLLRDWGRLSEALAWTCFECEINPHNVTAQALKAQLRSQLRLDSIDKVPETNIIRHELASSWHGVAGMRELKMIFERDIILPLREPDIYSLYKVPLPNGVLLYGPPGCGKTFIARKLSEMLKYKFFEIKPSDLASTYVHGTQEKIGELFNEAKATAPSMIFFDELEALVPNRSGSSVGYHYQSEVNEFLIHLNECHKKQILVIGATNLPDLIDAAILRPGRMDKKIFIAPPDLEARVEAFKIYLKDRPQVDINHIELAEQSEFYTFAELEFIVNEAARKALSSRSKITNDIVLGTLLNNKPSLSGSDIEKMKKFNL